MIFDKFVQKMRVKDLKRMGSGIKSNKVNFEKIFGKTVLDICEVSSDGIDSITGAISLKNRSIRKFRVAFDDNTNITAVCKYKSKRIIRNGIRIMNCQNSPRVYVQLVLNHRIYGFENSHIRETCFYKALPKELCGGIIDIYGLYYDRQTKQHMVVMKEQSGSAPENFNDLIRVINVITDFHSYYYNDDFVIKLFCLNNITTEGYKKSQKLIKLLFESVSDENTVLYSKNNLEILKTFADDLPKEHSLLPYHNSLCHNDLSKRNILCEDDRVYIYDWELAAYRNPEHDLIDLIASAADGLSDGEIFELIEYFRRTLSEKTGERLDDEMFWRLIRFNLLEYTLTRATLLRIANIKMKRDFILKIAHNTNRLMDILLKG